MKNHDYLLKCTQLIEEKMQAGNSSDWIDYNYSALHDQVFNATRVSISIRTLKRIFKSTDSYDPQMATKNAMALYLGYRDWAHFIKDHFEKQSGGKTEDTYWLEANSAPAAEILPPPPHKKRPAFLLIGSGIFLVILVVVGWLMFNGSSVTFNVKNIAGNAPLTTAISYDLSNISYKNAFIDFGNGGEYKLLLSPKGELAYQYKTPNFFRMRLVADGRTLARATVDVHTNDWVCYVGNNDANCQIVTDRKLFTNNTSLYFSPATISKLNIDTLKEFWVDYRNIRNFNVDGDQMTVEFRLRNSQDMGGFDCFDTALEFIGEHGRGYFKFVKPGCTQYADTEFGDTQLTGNFHNLSSLGVDLSKWTIVRIETSHKASMVYINNVFKFKTAYNTPIGNIRGFCCRFKGSGQLDFMRVFDAQRRLVYTDEFNR